MPYGCCKKTATSWVRRVTSTNEPYTTKECFKLGIQIATKQIIMHVGHLRLKCHEAILFSLRETTICGNARPAIGLQISGLQHARRDYIFGLHFMLKGPLVPNLSLSILPPRAQNAVH